MPASASRCRTINNTDNRFPIRPHTGGVAQPSQFQASAAKRGSFAVAHRPRTEPEDKAKNAGGEPSTNRASQSLPAQVALTCSPALTLAPLRGRQLLLCSEQNAALQIQQLFWRLRLITGFVRGDAVPTSLDTWSNRLVARGQTDSVEPSYECILFALRERLNVCDPPYSPKSNRSRRHSDGLLSQPLSRIHSDKSIPLTSTVTGCAALYLIVTGTMLRVARALGCEQITLYAGKLRLES
jgi:hypothetical protein